MPEIHEQLIGPNRSYAPLQAVGLAIHSTATPGATAQAEYSYFNSAYRGASAHYFVDWMQIIRTVPESEQAWHAGQTANERFISIEICEPAAGANQFNAVWDNAVWLARDICNRHGWGSDRIWSHDRISRTFGETDHTDPVGYFAQYGRTFDQFVNDIFSQPQEENMAIIPHGRIGDFYFSFNPAGVAITEEFPMVDSANKEVGRGQSYTKGIITWDNRTDATCHVYGDILGKYAQLGGSKVFGMPKTSERDVPGVPGARMNVFEFGNIYWSVQTKAHEVHGAILAEYIIQGEAAGKLGLPISDEYQKGTGRQSDFQHGSIYWQDGKGCTVTIK